jgi:dihydroxy-acid dehydratase
MGDAKLRSASWFDRDDLAGLMHRSALRVLGFADAAKSGRPLIGICNPWSELVNCNLHFRQLAEAVKRGVLERGGLPLEFSTMSLGENLMKPTTMLYRNLMAMEVEETLRAYPVDGVVLIGGCDKTIPAQLMGAASADVPAIAVTGGPAAPAVHRGRPLGSGTDLWHFVDEYRSGRVSAAELGELESALAPTPGHCTEMGTASTMASLTEALGMALPGTATIPAVHARRLAAAERVGARAVELAVEGVRPRDLMTAAALDNAIVLLMALGGSTNAVIHLLAIAGRLGIGLSLDRFDELARVTPVLADVRPSGAHLFEDLESAGGIPAVLGELAPLLDLTAPTVTGEPLGAALGKRSGAAIRPFSDPLRERGGIAVVRGTLAPRGAVVKTSAASQELLRHRGPAVVFDGIEDLAARLDDPHLDVTAESVLVLRNVGPVGGPGMPEWGAFPVPEKLLRDGVRDIVRVSDARMSGTAFGTCVLHVSPEAAVGGPLAAVRDGDPIVLDAFDGRLELDVSPAELDRRMAEVAPRPAVARGYRGLHSRHVLQADLGCDLDFLRLPDGAEPDTARAEVLEGWIGGW